MFLKNLRSREILSPCIDEDTSISNTLHQTWFSKDNRFLHIEIEASWNLNSDLNITLHDDDDLDVFMRWYWFDNPIYDIYSRSIFCPKKADIFSYLVCVIEPLGWYFCNISKTFTSSFGTFCGPESTVQSVTRGNRFFLPAQNYICNWAFGFSTGRPHTRRFMYKRIALAPRFEGWVFEDLDAAMSHALAQALLRNVCASIWRY